MPIPTHPLIWLTSSISIDPRLRKYNTKIASPIEISAAAIDKIIAKIEQEEKAQEEERLNTLNNLQNSTPTNTNTKRLIRQ